MKYAMSARSITIAIQGIAIIGLAAAVVLTARSAELAAAAAASLVQNVDEPARNFYQQNVTADNCSMCTFAFSPVPSGKTLRITHVSCYMNVGDTNGINVVELFSGTPVAKLTFIPAAIQGRAFTVIASGEVDSYSTAGGKPKIMVYANLSPVSDASCTIAGYYVTSSA